MDIRQSMQGILQRDKIVTDLFYTIFLDRYPEVREYFQGIDMNQQAIVLKMALMMIEQYHRHGYPGAAQYLKVLGRRHAERNIPSELYPRWRDCMLDTLQRFHGEQWNDALAEEWKAAIDSASELMLAGYNQNVLY